MFLSEVRTPRTFINSLSAACATENPKGFKGLHFSGSSKGVILRSDTIAVELVYLCT